MPENIIIASGADAEKAQDRTGTTFTGTVWSQLLGQTGNTAFANVVFMPCSRTHWHTHEGGQMLYVTVGSGWVCEKGGEPRRIKAGDAVWTEPGVTHWHGADKDGFMSHFTVGLKKTTWLEEVKDDLYTK